MSNIPKYKEIVIERVLLFFFFLQIVLYFTFYIYKYFVTDRSLTNTIITTFSLVLIVKIFKNKISDITLKPNNQFEFYLYQAIYYLIIAANIWLLIMVFFGKFIIAIINNIF